MRWREWWHDLWSSPANRLTSFRLALAFAAIFLARMGWPLFSYLVFTAAAVLDAVDGRVARKYDCVTDIGKVYDPLVDKVLVVGFLFFGIRFPPDLLIWRSWLLRCELLLASIGFSSLLYFGGGKKLFGANVFGKAKMISEVIFIELYFIEALGWGFLTEFMGLWFDKAIVLHWAVLLAIFSIVSHIVFSILANVPRSQKDRV